MHLFIDVFQTGGHLSNPSRSTGGQEGGLISQSGQEGGQRSNIGQQEGQRLSKAREEHSSTKEGID